MYLMTAAAVLDVPQSFQHGLQSNNVGNGSNLCIGTNLGFCTVGVWVANESIPDGRRVLLVDTHKRQTESLKLIAEFLATTQVQRFTYQD